MISAPSVTFLATVQGFATGLAADVGATIISDAGATVVARATGATEHATIPGLYLLTLTSPATEAHYLIDWDDGDGNHAYDDLYITSDEVVPTGDTYADVDELMRRLKIRTPTTEQEAQGEQVLLMATLEIDREIDLAADADALAGAELALVAEVNLERAVELWAESPFGILALETGDFGPTHTARNSWERYAHKLAPLKDQWGLA